MRWQARTLYKSKPRSSRFRSIRTFAHVCGRLRVTSSCTTRTCHQQALSTQYSAAQTVEVFNKSPPSCSQGLASRPVAARTPHALSMPSACTQYAISMHSACTRHALGMHSACTRHAIRMQLACNQNAIGMQSVAARTGCSESKCAALLSACGSSPSISILSMQSGCFSTASMRTVVTGCR